MLNQELKSKLKETQQLLDKMAMELRFRGCDDNHKLILQAHATSKWLAKQLASTQCG